MYLLPPNLRLLLAASCGTLVLLGGVIGTAAVLGQGELVAISALALTAVALGSFLLLGWQVARLVQAQGRLMDRLSGRLTVFEEPPKPEAAAPPAPSVPERRMPPPDDEARQVRQAEAFGRLWNGIAHDLNNRLMVISGNMDTVVRQMKDQPAVQRRLLSALVAADQAATLIARSSAFAQPREQKTQHVNLAERIESVAALMSRSLLRDTVELRLSLEEGLWGTQVDPGDLDTAIVALCANLRDTLAQGDAITIEAKNVTVTKGALSRADLEGDFVRITIGTSVPVDVPAGSGTRSDSLFTMQDMDLASWVEFNRSLHFLQPLGGMAEVTTLGPKSVVALYLPKARTPAHAAFPARNEEGVSGKAPSRTEILIVDDEIEVALALQVMLEELGYLVRVATDAGQVLKSLKTRKPGLLLAGVAMPGPMNGIVLAREARSIVPGLPVLLITGDPSIAESDSEFPLLRKPIVSRDLHVAIQRQLAPDAGKVISLFPKASRRMP
jgi:Response regulator containing CheY-like receiver, AAA-type ATPase, and DNA-binding domains